MSDLILLYILILFIAFSCKRSIAVTCIVSFYLFVLFAFNTGNVDYDAYAQAFYNPSLRMGDWEIGFVGLMFFLNNLDFEISVLYSIVSFVYLLTIAYIAKSFSRDQINHFLFFILITTFLLHVVQLRYSSAIIFILWGFVALLKVKNKYKAVFLFVICILVATCFHIISIFFFLYFIPVIFDIKKTYLFSILSIIFFIVGGVIIANFLSNSPFLFRLSKLVGNYSSHSEGFTIRFIGCIVEIFIYVFIFKKIYKYQLNKNKLCSDDKILVDDKELYFSQYAYGFSIVSLFFIPMLFMSTELHRILSVVDIVLLSFALYFSKIKQYRLFIYLCLFFNAILIFYCFIWGAMYDEFVFKPILTNNSFLN